MAAQGEKLIWYNMRVGDVLFGWESVMSQQYKAGDVVTVFQISPANELVIEGKATIHKRAADVDEQYRVEFTHKPGVKPTNGSSIAGADDPEKYLRDFNKRCAR
jgi:hypothetical protein